MAIQKFATICAALLVAVLAFASTAEARPLVVPTSKGQVVIAEAELCALPRGVNRQVRPGITVHVHVNGTVAVNNSWLGGRYCPKEAGYAARQKAQDAKSRSDDKAREAAQRRQAQAAAAARAAAQRAVDKTFNRPAPKAAASARPQQQVNPRQDATRSQGGTNVPTRTVKQEDLGGTPADAGERATDNGNKVPGIF